MYTTLIHVDELEALLASESPPVILDCRHDLANLDFGATLFEEGHIPNAQYANMETQLSGPHSPGAGRHPWPTDAQWTEQLSQWGIRPSTQVVVYDQGPGMFAARAWMLLRTSGHDAAAVLDGGLKAWLAAGKPVSGGAAVVPERVERAGVAFDRKRLLDADQLLDRMDEGWSVIDSRASDRYRGENETIDPKAGHIPGALNRPFISNLDEGGMFKSASQLRSELDELLNGVHPARSVFYCGSGVTAAHNVLAMEIAGLKDSSLYKGSWSGWIENDRHPIATGATP